MNGLLDFLKTPAGQGLLSAGLGIAANAGKGGTWNAIGRGGLMGLQGYTGAIENQKQIAERDAAAQFRALQADNLKAEMTARQQKRQLIDSVLGSAGGQPAPGAQAPQGAGVTGLSFDQLAALKMAGVDLTDIHKYANDPQKFEQGSTYRDRRTGEERVIPKLPEGMAPGAGGQYGFVPGYVNSVVGLEGAKARATEGTKAAFDPVQVVAPDGSTKYVPRLNVVAPNADADRYAILTQELERARRSGNAGDIAAVQAEISRLPAAARTAASPSGLAVAGGGHQATPSAAQAAEAAAMKEKAMKDAAAASGREQDKAKKAVTATDLLSQLQEARAILKNGPTSSGAGALMDSGAGFFGKSTKGADLSARLETISGWMVNNVPRMEGPQSNFDVQNYKSMAGLVGDRTKPVSQRMAALDTLEKLQKKYAGLNAGEATPDGSGGATGGWGDAKPPAPMKGMTRNGYRFKGGDPANPSSWEKM